LEKGKGKPFLEVLSSALHEDYRFPILEIFAFLYVLGTFALVNIGSLGFALGSVSGEAVAFRVVTSAIGFSLFVFLILIFKNIAFGLGSDLEKGIIQTYFSYPLKRSRILSAKLVSAVGVSIALFLGIQILALFILAPGVVLPHMGVVLLTYAASLSYPLIITGVLLIMAMILRRGALTLVIGIVLYFVLSIVSGIVTVLSLATNSPLPLQILSVFSPTTILSQYYSTTVSFFSATSWAPTFSQVLLSVAGSYVIAAVLFSIGYYYFSRRLNL
jgi:ABC-type transport system involved in multi-copper enzyme maturation permease subunit